MKIKRFFAKDMRAALAEVKDILGPDAVIMSNKKVTGGIEIVAAVDYQAATEVKALSREAKEGRDLKEDSVMLSSRTRQNPTQVSHAAVDQAKTINARAGQNLADSLSALLAKQGKSAPKMARPSAKPATLMEQNEWEQPKARPAPPRPPRSTVSGSSKDDQVLEAMREEMASLRKLLEHQVSGLMWQELERKEPVRAMLIKWLNKSGFSDDIADQLASCIPESCSPAEAKQYLSQLLEDQITIGENEILKLGGAVALLGPTGVGKTTTIAKLAARFAMEHGAE